MKKKQNEYQSIRKLATRNKNNLIKKICIFALLILLSAVVFIFLFVKQQKENSYNQARADITQSLEELNLEGEKVLETIEDKGCKKSDNMWVGSRSICSYEANAIYAGKEGLREKLYSADEKLKSNRWQRGEEWRNDLDRGFKIGNGQGAVRYYKYHSKGDKIMMSLNLYYYGPMKDKPASSLAEVFGDIQGFGGDLVLSSEDYLYGIKIEYVYSETASILP